MFPFPLYSGKIKDKDALRVNIGGKSMSEQVQKIIFFLISMAILFLVYLWAVYLIEGDSSYARFPTNIEKFR